MTTIRTEATAIARLYGRHQKAVIGWVYLWNTGELSVRWNEAERTVASVSPPIDPKKLDLRNRGVPDFLSLLTEVSRKPTDAS